MANLELVALIVRDYYPAIRFFVDVLQFELVEDTPSLTNDGRPKRWVVVRPIGAKTGILLARADGEQQAGVIGQQFAGRVGLFLRVDDFDASYERNGGHRRPIRVIPANRAVRQGCGVPRPRREPMGLARSAPSKRRR
jgi:catechol 2,3-dioxygenase-like lactoylglutathione lyase family enzyme